jgi:uncharacterized protein with NRDE domain
MCLAFFGLKVKEGIEFLLLFNRDEFFERETLPLGFHHNDQELKGKLFYSLDVITQGTFLCLNIDNGNFCILLNHNFKTNPYDKSLTLKRGQIPIDFCKLEPNENDFNKFISDLDEHKAEYNGFNIIYGNMKKNILFYYTNNNEDKSMPIKLEMGEMYAITNDLIFSSNKRAEYGLQLINVTLNKEHKDEKELVESLFKDMYDNNRTLELNLPQDYDFSNFNIMSIEPEIKRNLVSSVYVNDNINQHYINYGTRHTICIMLDDAGQLKTYEYFDEFENIEDGGIKVKQRDLNNLKLYKFN